MYINYRFPSSSPQLSNVSRNPSCVSYKFDLITCVKYIS